MEKKNILIVVVCIMFIFLQQSLNAQSWKILQKELNESVKNGDIETALSLAEQALPQAQKEFGTKHKNYAISLCDLGELYQEVGRYEEAEVLITQAIEIAKKKRGLKKEYIDYSVKLAELYEDLGKYEDALKLSNEALVLIDKSKKRDNLQYVEDMLLIARIFRYFGKFDEALSTNLKALEIIEEKLGTNNSLFVNCINSIGLIYSTIGKYDLALSYYSQALEIDYEIVGPYHTEYLIKLYNLACLHIKMYNFAKAEDLYKHIL